MNPLYVFVLPILVALIVVLGVLGPILAERFGRKGADSPVEYDD